MDPKHLLTQLDKETKDLVTYDIRTGEVVSRNGVLQEKAKFVYSLQVADMVCYYLREGLSYRKIGLKEGMPSIHILYRWEALHPDFKERVKNARAGRADYYRDKAEDALDRCVDKDSVTMTKLKFDGFMKLAEKDNPAQYGNTKEGGGGNAPLQIIVQTGISREPVTVEVINEREDGQNIGLSQQHSGSSVITVEAEGSERHKEPSINSEAEDREATNGEPDGTEKKF